MVEIAIGNRMKRSAINNMTYPIFYSLQHCPYAMRARFGLMLAKQAVMLRAVVMKNKPPEMLELSAKGTVPVLQLEDGRVIDESLDIMLWALANNDPDDLLLKQQQEKSAAMFALIAQNDNEYIDWLEKYKYAKRKHQADELMCRQQCELFIAELEQRLSKHAYFLGDKPCLADYAILPFIRQFARVDRQWYLQAPYPELRRWLNHHLQQPMFTKVMAKFPLWLDCEEAFLFAG